jgi:hypothetical protein
VQFAIGGRTFDLSNLSGSLDLSFLGGSGRYSIAGTVLGTSGAILATQTRPLALPLRTLSSASRNRAPVLAAIDAQRVVANNTLTFKLAATDPDGDDLQFEADSLPSGAELDPATGEFRWMPTNAQAGKQSINFSALDPSGHKSSIRVTIDVAFDSSRQPIVGSWTLASVDAGGGIADRSGYGHVGTTRDATPSSLGGLYCDGIDDSVRIAKSAAFMPTQALTVSIDVKPEGGRNHLTRLIGFDSGSISAYELTVKDGGSMVDAKGSLQGYWFSINTETGIHSISFRNTNWLGTELDRVTAVFDGEHDGGKLSLYVNGELKDQLTGVGTRIVYPTYGEQRVTLGSTADGQRAFRGRLANATISTAASPPVA